MQASESISKAIAHDFTALILCLITLLHRNAVRKSMHALYKTLRSELHRNAQHSSLTGFGMK